MLTLNILHLIKNKTIPISYNLSLDKINKNNKYIHNNIDANVFEIIQLLNSLSTLYLYIYKYISLKQKILFCNNYAQLTTITKSTALLTSNYYINNFNSFDIITNWNLVKNKLILYKWLEYFFFANLNLKNNYKKNSFINYTLYLLYCKLKLKYSGIKNLNKIPSTLIFITNNNNIKYLKKFVKLNKNTIIITNKKQNIHLDNVLEITLKNTNYSILFFILKIIATAIFHGLLN